jgi:xanthine dehydrogenase accessory factor
MKNIYAHLLRLLEKKKPIALATIVETRGSTPQVRGASALFSADGLLAGTLGGGIFEADAQKKAAQALKKKSSLLAEFLLEGNTLSEEEAVCGGEAKILIDSNPKEHKEAIQRLNQSISQRQAGVMATLIGRVSKEKVSLLRYWIERVEKYNGNLGKHFSFFREEVEKSFSEGEPRLLRVKEKVFPGDAEESFLFLEPVFPLLRLVIAGAGHIGQAVAHLGSLLNFEVTVIDDRPEFANKNRLPDADEIIVEDFDKAFQNVPLSSDTFLVIVTHGHRHDGTVLRQCIRSEVAYIGMIGSARKIELMRKEFLDKDWATSSQFDRVHAPIGLPIQSKTVEEIAVSIAAQLVLVRSQFSHKQE